MGRRLRLLQFPVCDRAAQAFLSLLPKFPPELPQRHTVFSCVANYTSFSPCDTDGCRHCSLILSFLCKSSPRLIPSALSNCKAIQSAHQRFYVLVCFCQQFIKRAITQFNFITIHSIVLGLTHYTN
jgi:hypothetical protein